MKKYYTFFLIFFLIATFSELKAQFVPGYIVTLKGDTVEVVFSDKVLNKHFKEIKCKKNLLSLAEETYSATAIKGFYLSQSNEYFYSKTIVIDKKSIELTQLESDPKPKNVTETVFVKLLVQGEANLYSYQDENAKKHFLFSKKNTPIQELIYLKYFTTQGIFRVIETYKLQLDTSLVGCKKNKTAFLDFEESKLKHVFEQYNVCFSNDISYIQESGKPKIAFKALVGFGNFEMIPADEIYSYNFYFNNARKVAFSNSKGNILLGGTLQILPRRVSSPILYDIELLFSKRSFSYLSVLDENPIKRTYKIELELNSIQIQPSLVYYLKGIVSPFARMGVSVGYFAASKNIGTAEVSFINISNDTYKYEPFINMSKFSYGAFGGLGIIFKKISAEVRFEGLRTSTISPPTNLDFTGIYGLVAYKF